MSQPTTEFALKNFCELEGLYYQGVSHDHSNNGDLCYIIRPYGYAVLHCYVSNKWKLSASIKHIREHVVEWRKLKVLR